MTHTEEYPLTGWETAIWITVFSILGIALIAVLSLVCFVADNRK